MQVDKIKDGLLDNKTREMLNFIAEYIEKFGLSPSIPEIMSAIDSKSVRGVGLRLDKLEFHGYIKRIPNTRRSISIIIEIEDLTEELIKVPLIGEIQAGPDRFADQAWESFREIPISELRGRRDAFLLRVRGRSMVNAGYHPGDTLIIIPKPVPDNNDIVVAYLIGDDTATLKRYKKVDGYIALLPDSDDPTFKPIIGTESDFKFQGKVIGKFEE